jgi:hypothetical protein
MIARRRHNAVVSSVWDGVRDRVIDVWGNTSHYTPSYCLETYGTVLAPPMTAEDLADLETWLGVSLPEEYRSFLLQVSADGIYVFPVQRGAQLPDDYRRRVDLSFNVAADGSLVRVRPVPYDEWEWVNQPSGVDPSLVIQPFSTLRADDETWMVMSGAPPAEEDFGDPDEFQHAFDEWCGRATHRINNHAGADTARSRWSVLRRISRLGFFADADAVGDVIVRSLQVALVSVLQRLFRKRLPIRAGPIDEPDLLACAVLVGSEAVALTRAPDVVHDAGGSDLDEHFAAAVGAVPAAELPTGTGPPRARVAVAAAAGVVGDGVGAGADPDRMTDVRAPDGR